jgi:preprotein translocase subunit YajC
MIRPQMKRQKEHKAMMAAVTRGDEIVTTGGLLGRVTKVSDVYLSIEVQEGTEIVVQKSALSTLLPKGTLKSL